MRRHMILLALGGLVCSCERPTGAVKAERAATSAEVNESRSGTARRLALQSPNGSAAGDELVVQVQRAAEHNPSKGELWVMLGRSWVRKARETADPGFYLNAKAAAEVALELGPGDPTALDLEGIVLLNEHRFEEARALVQSVVDTYPDDPAALGTLSDAMLELGRFDEAARSAQAMLDLKPNLPSYSRGSYLRWLQGDVEGAKHLARLAIDSGGGQRDPEPRAWVLTQAATIFCREGDYAGADAGFDQALRQIGDYPPALVGKARVALARSDGQRAAGLLEHAYEASPLAETAWLLGDARSMAGDTAGAEEAYRRVERVGRQTDHRTLASFWATRNEHAAEALAFAEAEKTVRGDVYTDDVYAWALYRNRKVAEARTAIDRALARGTRDARLWYHAGAIRVASGDLQAGRRQVQQALKLEPAFDVTAAAEARRLLADGQR